MRSTKLYGKVFSGGSSLKVLLYWAALRCKYMLLYKCQAGDSCEAHAEPKPFLQQSVVKCLARRNLKSSLLSQYSFISLKMSQPYIIWKDCLKSLVLVSVLLFLNVIYSVLQCLRWRREKYSDICHLTHRSWQSILGGISKRNSMTGNMTHHA